MADDGTGVRGDRRRDPPAAGAQHSCAALAGWWPTQTPTSKPPTPTVGAGQHSRRRGLRRRRRLVCERGGRQRRVARGPGRSHPHVTVVASMAPFGGRPRQEVPTGLVAPPTAPCGAVRRCPGRGRPDRGGRPATLSGRRPARSPRSLWLPPHRAWPCSTTAADRPTTTGGGSCWSTARLTGAGWLPPGWTGQSGWLDCPTAATSSPRPTTTRLRLLTPRVRGQQAGIVLAHGDPTLAHRAGHHRPVCAPTAADALP